jgi:hypothetical protein
MCVSFGRWGVRSFWFWFRKREKKKGQKKNNIRSLHSFAAAGASPVNDTESNAGCAIRE